MKSKLKIAFFVLAAVLLCEVIVVLSKFDNRERAMKEKYAQDSQVKLLNKEKEKKSILDDFEKKRYAATGKNVYERVYNRQEQTIEDLLLSLAVESFPDGWECKIKVEEFTNLILLVQIGDRDDALNIEEVSKYLIPIVRHGLPYLKDVAVYDRQHKCYLFFSEKHLKQLADAGRLADLSPREIESDGAKFIRYNSIKVDFNEINGHIILPVTIMGDSGVYEVSMMLDTGASMSVISLELAQKTGQEDLNKAPRKSFLTAKGYMTCPIVTRTISAGGIDVEKPVAVNIEDEANLLGVDFFEDKEYLIDAKADAIYIWYK